MTDRSITSENAAALSGLFLMSTLKGLAEVGEPTKFKSLIAESNVVSVVNPDTKIREIFDLAFDFLIKRDFRSEYVYKAALFEKIILGKNSVNTATAISELRINQSKLDVAILNGSSVAYEIKSERDNLRKVLKQVMDYRQVFPEVVVVAGENHLYKLLGILPEEVGVMILSRRFQLSELRPAVSDCSYLRSSAICSTLRLAEGKQILKDFGHKIPELPNTMIHEAVFSELRQLSPVDLQYAMLRVMKKTRGLKPKADTIDFLPRSLKSITTSIRFTKKELSRLQNRMDDPISTMS